MPIGLIDFLVVGCQAPLARSLTAVRGSIALIAWLESRRSTFILCRRSCVAAQRPVGQWGSKTTPSGISRTYEECEGTLSH